MTTAQIKTALSLPDANVQQLVSETINQLEQLVSQVSQLQTQYAQLSQAFTQHRTAYGQHTHVFWTTDANGKQVSFQNGGAVVLVPAPRNQFDTAIGLPNAQPGALVTLSRPV